MSKQVTPETLAAALRSESLRWDDAAAAIYAALPDQPDALDAALRYVRMNLAVWSQDASGDPPGARQLAAAYRDIFQKVLNVMEGRQPLDDVATSAAAGEGGEG